MLAGSLSTALLLALPLSAMAHSRPEGAHPGGPELVARAAKSDAGSVTAAVAATMTTAPASKAAAKATTYADGNTFLTSTLPSVFPAGATAFPGAPALPDSKSSVFLGARWMAPGLMGVLVASSQQDRLQRVPPAGQAPSPRLHRSQGKRPPLDLGEQVAHCGSRPAPRR